MDTNLDLRWLPHHLADVGYTAEALKHILGVTFPDDVGVLNYAPAVHRVGDHRDPVATLIRLFFLEADETYRNVSAVLPRRGCETLIHARVLHTHGAKVRARVRIDPVGEHYVIADRRFRSFDRGALGVAGRDPVYPASSDSLMLRDAIIAADAPRTLDVCTGSGVQALQRARHSERVVAVDINPRAAAIARLNAQLNGVENVEVRIGDLYAPTRGEQFDVVIANPPFVASPYVTAPGYHSGGARGDGVLRRIFGGLGRHLRPGGRAFAISHLGLGAGEDLHAVAGRWFRNFPGRALVLVAETGTPVDLAAAQSLFALDRGLAAYAREVQRWVDYLRRQRIRTIALLLIVAECGNGRGVDVVEAQPRILPIPLSPAPAARVTAWLTSKSNAPA